jgi:propanediol dehydratase small subunit
MISVPKSLGHETFMLQLSVIIFFAVALFAFTLIHERQKMRYYLERGCTGFRWRRRFPQASKSEIREFLDVFVEAFGYRRNWRLRFAPDDRVMDFYRIRYPIHGEPDGMELEDLVTLLSKRYGVDILHSWREDITLADLFTQTRRPVA